MNQLANILPSWDDAVNNLKAKANEFQRNYNLMVSVEPYLKRYPALYAEYNDVKKSADFARSSVQSIASLIDSGYRWFNGSGLSGNNLGFIFPVVPVVGVAAIVAAAGTLAYLIPKMYEIYTKGELVKSGQLPGNVAFPPNSSFGDGLTEIGKALPWIVAGIGVYMLLPYLKGKK